ncbi:MAG: hypothetical protein ACTSY1_07520, partial [Alphaproteobacteria bacterium]
ASTLTLVVDRGSTIEIIIVGDSGLRINGHECIQLNKSVDVITLEIRLKMYQIFSGNGHRGNRLEMMTRDAVFAGLDSLPPGAAFQGTKAPGASQPCRHLARAAA